MGIDYSGMMIVGVYFDDLPEKLQEQLEENEDWYEWMEKHELESASQWYDCGLEGMIFGVSMPDVKEAHMQEWLDHLAKAFDKVRQTLKSEPELIGTQDIY